jgi:hypothetical protein
MNDQTDDQTTGDIGLPPTSYIPATTNSGKNSIAQDFDSLKEWFDSEEFLQNLTSGFWEAKKRAIAERDSLLQSGLVNEGQS